MASFKHPASSIKWGKKMKTKYLLLMVASLFLLSCSQPKEQIFKDTFKDSFYVGTAMNRMQNYGGRPEIIGTDRKTFQQPDT